MKPGGDAGNFVGVVARIEHVDAFDHFFQQCGHFEEALFGFRRAFGNLEDFVFGFVQKLACVAPCGL